jgi:hypothetical protein
VTATKLRRPGDPGLFAEAAAVTLRPLILLESLNARWSGLAIRCDGCTGAKFAAEVADGAPGILRACGKRSACFYG